MWQFVALDQECAFPGFLNQGAVCSVVFNGTTCALAVCSRQVRACNVAVQRSRACNVAAAASLDPATSLALHLADAVTVMKPPHQDPGFRNYTLFSKYPHIAKLFSCSGFKGVWLE